MEGWFSENTYPRNAKVLTSIFINHVTRLDTSVLWFYSLLDGGEEISYIDSRLIFANDMLVFMMQVSRPVQHSIEVRLSRFVTVTQPKCRVWNASGGKRILLVKCGGSYAVCVVTWCFWQQGCCRMQNLYTRGETKGYVTFKCISFLYTDIRLAGWTDESSGHTHTVQQYEQHNDWLSGK